MITINDMRWFATNNMDAIRAEVGRRSIYVINSTVNFWGIHISIFLQSLVHWPTIFCATTLLSCSANFRWGLHKISNTNTWNMEIQVRSIEALTFCPRLANRMLFIMVNYASIRPRKLCRIIMYSDRSFWKSDAEECCSEKVLATILKMIPMHLTVPSCVVVFPWRIYWGPRPRHYQYKPSRGINNLIFWRG